MHERAKRNLEEEERITVFGEIKFMGREIKELSPWDRMGISLCPERRRIFPEMTVLESLMVGAYLRKDKDAVKKI